MSRPSSVRSGLLAREQRVAAEAFLKLAQGRQAIAGRRFAIERSVAAEQDEWEGLKDQLVVIKSLRFAADELIAYWREVGVPIDDADEEVCKQIDLEWARDVVAAEDPRGLSSLHKLPDDVHPRNLPLLLAGDPDHQVGVVRFGPDVDPFQLDGTLLGLSVAEDGTIVALSISLIPWQAAP